MNFNIVRQLFVLSLVVLGCCSIASCKPTPNDMPMTKPSFSSQESNISDNRTDIQDTNGTSNNNISIALIHKLEFVRLLANISIVIGASGLWLSVSKLAAFAADKRRFRLTFTSDVGIGVPLLVIGAASCILFNFMYAELETGIGSRPFSIEEERIFSNFLKAIRKKDYSQAERYVRLMEEHGDSIRANTMTRELHRQMSDSH